MKKTIILSGDKPYKNFPEHPGVYLMKNKGGKILYIGKAANLKKRVSSYFLKPQESRIENLLRQITKIEFAETSNALEALILESKLIKKHQPPFNIREKDDKSFLFIEVTNEEFPRLLLARGKDIPLGKRFGPFALAGEAREVLRLIRKIFPFNTHLPREINCGKPCLNYQIGLCPGTCINKITPHEYKKTIKKIEMILSGKTSNLIKKLEKEMKEEAEKLNFEKAQEIKKQIISLKHLEDIALIKDEKEEMDFSSFEEKEIRIEGYDISNIGGNYAVGSMVVFINNQPQKKEYRIFKIKNSSSTNDLAMLSEVISRRFLHKEWKYPNLILVDGGENQVKAVKNALKAVKVEIPIVGIAKGVKRKKNDFYGEIPSFTSKSVLIKVRDEAHRFALKHHKKIRKKAFLFSFFML